MFHIVIEGKMCLRSKLLHLWLSQATTFFFGIWCQKMLPNTIHGCHFDNISSSSKKFSVLDILDRLVYLAKAAT
jgi:hypothetical protein